MAEDTERAREAYEAALRSAASAFLRATVKGATNWPYEEMEALDDALLALKEPCR